MNKNPLSNSQALRRGTTAGFSLVEMLIVIALIAIVGTLVVGRLGNFFGQGQESAAQQFVNSSLDAPLMQYRIHMGSYPTTEEGLQALLTAPAGKGNKWKGPYIERMPEDPWGKPYQYRFPGTRNTGGFDLWSFGADGVESADDIGNWE